MKGAVAACLALLGVAACADESVAPVDPGPMETSYGGTLAVDIHGSADVTVVADGLGGASFTIALTGVDTSGLWDAAVPLAAEGRVDAFPEAKTVLYAAKISLPASPGGPCDDEPISLALALRRASGNAHVGGALTAYCGAAHHFGVPVRMLRLSGDLPAK